jgi:hypothetical protein
MGAILAFLLKLAGSSAVDKALGYFERKAASETERQRIQSLQATNDANNRRDVIVAGMQHRMFWVAWSIAALPTAAWYGWGMLDSLCNGALPDVAALPPQLKAYADTVWSNIFYTGAGVAGVTGAASIVAKAIAAGRK